MNIGRLYRTLRHVPLPLLGARAVHVARRMLCRALPGLVRWRLRRIGSNAPPLNLAPFVGFHAPDRAGLGLPRHLEFDNRVLSAAGTDIALGPVPDWTGAGLSAHGRYRLHSFEYAEEIASAAHEGERQKAWEFAKQLIGTWIDDCPAPGSPAWDAFPVSLRCANWLKLLAQFPKELSADRDFARRVTRSLYAHAHHLSKNVEYHLRLNHLMENGRALVFLGAAFRDPRGDRWLRAGRRIIDRAVREQFFADGCHVERSPMYHAIVLELLCDCVDVLEALGRPASASWRDCIDRAAGFLDSIVHPDGALPLINDSAADGSRAAGVVVGRTTRVPGGRGPRRADRLGVAEDGHSPGASPSRFHVIANGSSHLVIDAGAPSPPYNPGHAHAGALSYELSVNGTRFVVDTGGGIYGTGPERDRVRSTRAHNTVSVDGLDQSEVWGAFRVGRRATVRVFSQETTDQATRLAASCVHADRRTTHVREWIVEGSRVRIRDRVSGPGCTAVEQRIHLAPGCEVEQESEDTWRVTGGGTTAWIRVLAPWSVTVEDCAVAHQFGRKTAAICVVLAARGDAIVGEYQITW
jgi:uncharacterized heparinase superfamily protein